ncbi:enamine deaminase RidA (YjgF/YER057c/UK114 family) [Rhodoligotrophos appendicifer]|uniref:RidA family protein n=1 Tax=Rhodoligotrophos appendicifer TaxID=987056 RepID=UPI001FE8C064|nr:RidA family protein [Rhodoligotrophos appendicifer]
MIKRSGPMKIGHKGVEYGKTVYVGGVIANDLTLDMKGQTKQIAEKIDAVLAEHGTSKDRLLSATIFVTDLNQRPLMNEAWAEWLDPAQLPARATIGVNDLGPNVLIEITAVAAI